MRMAAAVLLAWTIAAGSASAAEPVQSDHRGTETSTVVKAKDAVKDGAKAIGHATRDVTRAIGHATRDAVKAIGHGARDAAKGTREAVEDAWDGATAKEK